MDTMDGVMGDGLSMAGIITIHLRDAKFMTNKEKFKLIPDSKLNRMVKLYPEKTEFYFDRPSTFFEYLLDVYHDQKLHMPNDICGAVIKEELEFWGIPKDYIAPCCLKTYSLYLNNLHIMKDIVNTLGNEYEDINIKDTEKENQSDKYSVVSEENNENISDATDINNDKPTNSTRQRSLMNNQNLTWKKKVNVFFEDPFSSSLALLWGCIFLILVLISVTIECLTTHKDFRKPLIHKTWHFNDSCNESTNAKLKMYLTTEIHPVLKYLQLVCLIVFTIELVTRFFTCNNKKKFLLNVYNIIDLLALIPMAVLETMYLTMDGHMLYTNTKKFNMVMFLSIMGILGVFKTLRLVKFARHYNAMNIVLLVIKSSIQEMLLLLLLIGIGTLIFSILIYYAEFNTDDTFQSIPVGFWWSIVTMTTVGFGDIHPTSSFGYIVGGICAISGIICTGLLIPILSSNFNSYHKFAKIYRCKCSINQSIRDPNPQKGKNFIERVKTVKNGVSNRKSSLGNVTFNINLKPYK